MGDLQHGDRVARDPRYRALVSRRGRFTWSLSAIILAAYFGFILLIAFDRQLLARPVGDGVTSLGIPVGLGIIILAILLTGIYVFRANREFDAVVETIREDIDA